ncbi:hypothetical protein A2U01_0089182 [Trifolium medium]|uniref:Uncharacterized protein n=1 Tax=Trifolium medium TaxID=97028 RepID=A0A392U380_9FABA|nr:hypothetical protein [Trifolium medium]
MNVAGIGYRLARSHTTEFRTGIGIGTGTKTQTALL